MSYQSEYETCIVIKKVAKVLAGGSQSDVSSMIKEHTEYLNKLQYINIILSLNSLNKNKICFN